MLRGGRGRRESGAPRLSSPRDRHHRRGRRFQRGLAVALSRSQSLDTAVRHASAVAALAVTGRSPALNARSASGRPFPALIRALGGSSSPGRDPPPMVTERQWCMVCDCLCQAVEDSRREGSAEPRQGM